MLCFCGCGQYATAWHHAVTRQEIKRHVPPVHGRQNRALHDRRNLVPAHFQCHLAHHNASRRFPATALPDSVFVFAREILGPGRAYNELRRAYAGEDPRLEALLAEHDEAAA
jgi:hypothetical protein